MTKTMAINIRSLLRRSAILALSVTIVLVIVITARTLTLSVATDETELFDSTDADYINVSEAVLGRFQSALRFRTVSTEPGVYDREELTKLRLFIEKVFPLVHSSPLVEKEVVANHSLLYKVKGTNDKLLPYLLASHMDVVPANPKNWEVPPFDGKIHDGCIYGRGTIDDKHGVMAILEALEYLLSKGFKPQRTFYIGFGHDEEVAGGDGAAAIGRRLETKGVKRLLFLVDEGLTVLNGVVPGISRPVALVGTTEKGQVVLRLRVEGSPSHSSMPPPESALTILTRAVHRLNTVPLPSMFGKGPEIDTFQHIAPHMKLPFRVVMSNLWLFKPLVSWALSRKPSTNAIVRTVTSVTRFESGIKDNVVPGEAMAIVNHRIHPANTVEEVIEMDREIINDDRVKIEIKNSMEAHPMSPYDRDSFGYQVMKNTIRQVWRDSVVAPGVMVGNTDTRHYLHLTDSVYRFSPTFMYPHDVPRFHGDNERITVKNYEQAINFFHLLMRNANEATPAVAHIAKHEEL